MGNNFNTPTNQKNEKRHLLPKKLTINSTKNILNLLPNLNNKTPVESKSSQELESFIDDKCNGLAQGSLKRHAEMKQQISQELGAHYNTILAKSSKKFTFCEKSYGEKNLFKILMKSKMSDSKCHNINMNNKNDKIPESAQAELR